MRIFPAPGTCSRALSSNVYHSTSYQNAILLSSVCERILQLPRLNSARSLSPQHCVQRLVASTAAETPDQVDLAALAIDEAERAKCPR